MVARRILDYTTEFVIYLSYRIALLEDAADGNLCKIPVVISNYSASG